MLIRTYKKELLRSTLRMVLLCDGHGDVVSLQSPPLVVLRVDPGPHRQLVDEDLGGFGEQDGRLGRDHLNVFVQFHDLKK